MFMYYETFIQTFVYTVLCKKYLSVELADKKIIGAGRRSEYYRKYGNPNFGGK